MGKEGFRYPLSSKYNGQAAFAPPRKRSGRREDFASGTTAGTGPVRIEAARLAGTVSRQPARMTR